MANRVAGKQSFSFVAGLNTEASYLTYPPNTWKEGNNVVPQVNGELHKRLAIDFEASYENILTTPLVVDDEEAFAFTVNEWRNIAGTATNLVVSQIGNILYFHDNYGASLSPTKRAFTLDLLSMSIVGGFSDQVAVLPISVASANGKLVVAHKYIDPFIITYDGDTDTITTHTLTLKMRDLYGIKDDGTSSMVEHVITMSEELHYNLNNQGWTDTLLTSYWDASATTVISPSAFGGFLSGALTTSYVGQYWPNNAQVWTAGKNAASPQVFSKSFLDAIDFGSSPAPKGRNVIDVFDRRRATFPCLTGTTGAQTGRFSSELVTLSRDTENTRPTQVTFWAGRAWYAGIEDSTFLSNMVLFSQTTLDDSEFDSCYQVADPTSETMSEIVASDGGVIPIHGIGKVLRLVPMHNSLVIFADNGVWQIQGNDTGFSALGYAVSKVSSVGAVSSASIIEVDTSVFYLTSSAIYVLNLAESSLSFNAVPITDMVIKTTIENIPTTAKYYSKAIYDEEEKLIYWVYNGEESPDGIEDNYTKTHGIVFDLRLKAFYTISMPVPAAGSTTPHILDGILTTGGTSTGNNFIVVDSNGDTVVDSSVNQVVAGYVYPVGSNKMIKWLCCRPLIATSFNYTFADNLVSYNRDCPEKFRDWYSHDNVGTAVRASITTGYDLVEDSDKKKQALYITVHSVKTETGCDVDFNVINPSSCMMQTQWDWTSNSNANKWSSEQQVYRHTRPFTPEVITDVQSDGYPVITTKNKVRGRGRAVAIKFSDEADKDMKIIGWEALYVANSNV